MTCIGVARSQGTVWGWWRGRGTWRSRWPHSSCSASLTTCPSRTVGETWRYFELGRCVVQEGGPAIANAEHVAHCLEERPRVLLKPVGVLLPELIRFLWFGRNRNFVNSNFWLSTTIIGQMYLLSISKSWVINICFCRLEPHLQLSVLCQYGSDQLRTYVLPRW